MTLQFVVRGLDPRIHDEAQHTMNFHMDRRVKSGDDEFDLSWDSAVNSFSIMRGLDPRIQSHMGEPSTFALDRRVKSGDERMLLNRYGKRLNRNRELCGLPQRTENTSFFQFPVTPNMRASLLNLNRKMKP